MKVKTGPRLRELSTAARDSLDAESRNLAQAFYFMSVLNAFQSVSARRWSTPAWPSPSRPSPTSSPSASAAPRSSRPSARSVSTPPSASWQSTPSNAGMGS